MYVYVFFVRYETELCTIREVFLCEVNLVNIQNADKVFNERRRSIRDVESLLCIKNTFIRKNIVSVYLHRTS